MPQYYYHDYDYVRERYHVPAEKGRRVRAYGKPGTIISAFGHHIGIRLDGEKYTGRYHPVDGIEYLNEDGSVML